MKRSAFFFCAVLLLAAACKKNDQTPTPGATLSTTVSSQLAKTDSLGIFTNFFKAASFTDADADSGLTVFAPSNSAFGNASVTSTTMLPDSSVLKDYIVKGVLKASDFTNNKTFTTLSGKTLTVTVVGDPIILINGVIINISAISSGSNYVIYGAAQLLNAPTPLFFTVWDATTWTSGKPKGDPAAQATVALYHTQQDYASNAAAYSATADNDGVAEIKGVMPGQYYVVASKGTASNVFSIYTELQNGVYTGYAADTTIDNSGNIVWKDLNQDGKVDANDQTAQPALSVQASKNKTTNTTILIGYFYKPLQTAADAQAKLTAVYSGLLSAYYNMVVIDGILSDDAGCGSMTSYCPFDNFTANPTISSLATVWNNAYFTNMNALNYVLRDVPGMSIDAGQKADLVAQAKGLRAYIYLELLTYFGDVPIFQDLSSNFYPGIMRSASSDVYNLVVTDLTAAAADLPATRTDGKLSLTKGAALGLLAKAALWKRDYTSLLNYTTQIINSGSYSLTANYSWLTDPNSAETIWAPSFSSIGTAASWYYTGAFGSVTVQVCPVLRYGQVLLMDAEARNANADYAGMLQDLNLLRQRSSLSTFPPNDYSNVLPDLQTTWQTEMYLQGDRFANLVRWGIAQSVLFNNNYNYAVDNLLPIPQSFINQYPGMVQNPGY